MTHDGRELISAVCTSCGYRGEISSLGVRVGPRCRGNCEWKDDRAPQDPELFPPVFEFGDVVQWRDKQGVVVEQLCRDGLVAVAVNAVVHVTGPQYLKLLQPAERG